MCEEPNIMIVLDRSGSMRDSNKWNQAVGAIDGLQLIFEFYAHRFDYFPTAATAVSGSNVGFGNGEFSWNILSNFRGRFPMGYAHGPALQQAQNYFST